jgi:hypothetical protein
MDRLLILPDKEEVPGSNPGAPTSDLQGFLPLDPPLRPPLARFLQPKCLHLDGTSRPPLAPDVKGTRPGLPSAQTGWMGVCFAT